MTCNQILKKKIPSASVSTGEEMNAKAPWALLCRKEGRVITSL